MAESETRLETLEDEVKVLKGEVKRTLVDLRALLMREDSPLGEASIAKRAAIQMAMQNPMVASEAPKPVAEEAAAPAPAPMPTPALDLAPEPEPVAEPIVLTPEPGPGPGPGPGAPLQTVAESVQPGPGPGPGVFPVDSRDPTPQPGAAPGPPPADVSALFAQEEGLKVAEELKMVEQKLAELAIGETEDDKALPEPALEKRPKAPVPPVMAEPEDLEDNDDESAYELEEVIPRPSKNGRSKLAAKQVDADDESDQAEEAAEGDEGDQFVSRGKSDRVTSIYDEYRDLLEETKQVQPIEDSPVGPPLDINLLSNLVYWAALAKQRVGEEQLKDLIQLYIQSGHSRPELKDLLMHISNMVDADSPDVDEGTGDWVDLMFHLHGILTGGFPVVKIPQIKFPLPEEPAEEDDGY